MNDLIALAANVALTLSVIIAVVFGIAQARGAARDRRERLSLQALRSFQTREFVELMQYINSHEMPENSDDLTKAPVRDQIVHAIWSRNGNFGHSRRGKVHRY